MEASKVNLQIVRGFTGDYVFRVWVPDKFLRRFFSGHTLRIAQCSTYATFKDAWNWINMLESWNKA